VAFKNYYELTKSGLVLGNVITVMGGFLVASRVFAPQRAPDLGLLALTIIGILLVMASGCVFNNVIDRDIDRLMERTKDRAVVKGRVSVRSAIAFAIVLGILGFAILALYTNFLTVGVALVGYFFYVVMYSLWWKRRSPWGTFVGAISGATPPVVGYCAVSNRLDLGALLLFAILVLWQMPHFFAIGIRRFSEYAAAKIPILPVKEGSPATKKAMLLYIIAFTIVAPFLTVFGYAGYIYLAVVVVLSLIWLGWCMKGFSDVGAGADVKWARTMFFLSLFILVTTFITLSVGR
jgi:protoheme IX farnesyltransferase